MTSPRRTINATRIRRDHHNPYQKATKALLDENAVKTVFPKYPGHKEAEAAWQRHHNGKRTAFLRERYGVEKDPVPFREIAENMLSRGVESVELAEVIKRCSELARLDADAGQGGVL
jgi:hypothetical protein